MTKIFFILQYIESGKLRKLKAAYLLTPANYEMGSYVIFKILKY